MDRYACIHCHFYQPPRENPWFGEVIRQDSASPFHDWNQRITYECYESNTASRILGTNKEILAIKNNYEDISFNFGPTLLSWIQKRRPELYQNIINADKKSQEKFSGHGSAIAQVYNHIIMPLANRRDKETQVIWGIKDFVYRFDRYPEGIWLSETAVDLETLEIIAENDIKFTILAPAQASRIKKIDTNSWEELNGKTIDTSKAYLCKLKSGKSVTLFFYNGQISQGIAFGELLNNGENFANRLVADFSDNKKEQLVHIATDGETYGHHKRHGNMALAYCIYHIKKQNLAQMTLYGEFLEKHPPEYEVEIVENSSWSCAHGVERWKSDCSCGSGMHPGWNQKWRTPLRNAMDWLQNQLINIFENEIGKFVHNPWDARNDYINTILDTSDDTLDNFLAKHSDRKLSGKDEATIIKLLEMQKYAMFMYTSCAWFFDDISRIETVQVMSCAARAMELANDISGVSFQKDFCNILKQAQSNIPAFSTGDNIYEMQVKPTIPANNIYNLYKRFLE